MNDRVVQIRKAVNISAKDFAEKIGFTPGFVSHMEKGQRNINERVQKLICSEFNVNPVWLKTGEGEMFLPYQDDTVADFCTKNNISGRAKTIVTAYSKLNEDAKQYFEVFLDSLFEELQNEIEQKSVMSEEEYVKLAAEQARQAFRQANGNM